MHYFQDSYKLLSSIQCNATVLLTRGRVSTTYIKLLFGLVLRTQFNSCSSSRQRALNPERGWLQRHIAACKHNGTKIIRIQLTISYLHYILAAAENILGLSFKNRNKNTLWPTSMEKGKLTPFHCSYVICICKLN